MTAIYKRELRSYFDSMTGYIFIAFLVMFMGVYYLAYNLNGGYPYFSYTLSSLLIVMMVGIPILTMRSLSDEKRSKTDQLLLTAPVSVAEIVLGKYVSMVTIFAIPVLIFCLGPLIIKLNGNAYLREDYAAILAFFLLGCLFIAIGLFISSLTESQIIASVATFGILLALILWPGILSFLPTTAEASLAGFLLIWVAVVAIVHKMTSHRKLSYMLFGVGGIGFLTVYFVDKTLLEHKLVQFLGGFSVTETFNNFVYNSIFDIGGLVFYLTMIFLFVFLTIQSVEKRRWS